MDLKSAFDQALGGHRAKLDKLGWDTCYAYRAKYQRTLTGTKGFVTVRIGYFPATSEKPEIYHFRATVPHLEHPPEGTDWRELADEEDFWEYVHTFDAELLIRKYPPRSTSVAPGTGCRCGKFRFTEQAANEALLGAKIARALRGNRRRRECRVYECPGDSEVFHLTSQPQGAHTSQESA